MPETLTSSTEQQRIPREEIAVGVGSIACEVEASPELAANYPGNWMNLQHERMLGKDFQDKFRNFREAFVDTLADSPAKVPEFGQPWAHKYEKRKKDHYKAQLDRLPDTIGLTHGAVNYGPARAYKKMPGNLGVGNIMTRGTVFTDAESAQQPLEDRQKDIIAAHEAYHGVVNVVGKDKDIVASGFDPAALETAESDIKDTNLVSHPDELLARMAQLKNYFGMKGTETFTDAHLDYARAHYVADTGLDNNMREFFGLITDKTRPVFISNMNTLPV